MKPCCSLAAPEPCFASILEGGNGQDIAPPITTTDSNLAACSTALNVLSGCEAATSGFDNLANSDAASCLCYNSAGSWAPSAFDLPYSSCVAFARTADTSDYSGMTDGLGLCSSVGDIMKSGAPSTTAAGTGATSAGVSRSTIAASTASATAATTHSSVATTTASSTTATTAPSSAGLLMASVSLLMHELSTRGWFGMEADRRRFLASTRQCLC